MPCPCEDAGHGDGGVFRSHHLAGILVGRRTDAEHRSHDDRRGHQVPPTADSASRAVVDDIRAALQHHPQRKRLYRLPGRPPILARFCPLPAFSGCGNSGHRPRDYGAGASEALQAEGKMRIRIQRQVFETPSVFRAELVDGFHDAIDDRLYGVAGTEIVTGNSPAAIDLAV